MRKNTLIIISSLLLVFAMQACASSHCTRKGTNRSIKVMSYNIHIASPPSVLPEFSFTDLKAVAAVINREKSDLIALQEVDAYTKRSGKDSHQAKELAEMTGMYYHFAKAIDRSEGDYGVAILSKHPILSSESYKLPVTEGSKGETRALAVVTVDVLNQHVVFMSVHLDHRSDVDRKFQVEELLKITEKYDQYPVILCGDFNMRPDNSIFGLIEHQFVMGCTNHPLTIPSTEPKITLDYIMLNKKAAGLFNILSYNTVEEKYASDHLPVKMEVTIK